MLAAAPSLRIGFLEAFEPIRRSEARYADRAPTALTASTEGHVPMAEAKGCEAAKAAA